MPFGVDAGGSGLRSARNLLVAWRGLVAAAAAVAAQWLLWRAEPRAPFAPISAGQWIVTHAPGGIATDVVERLGHHAVPVLEWLMILAGLTLGVVLRGQRPAVLGGSAFTLTLVAVYLDPISHETDYIFAAATVAGLGALAAAFALSPPLHTEASLPERGLLVSRRRVMTGIALGLGMLTLGGVAALRSLLEGAASVMVIADSPLRLAVDPRFANIAGLSPAVTPTPDHYVVDIDLTDPFLSESDWRLTLDGLVADELALSLEDLRRDYTEEELVTLTCISNPVGGNLVGTSRWTGVPLASLLDRARPSADAHTVVAHAADGYSETIPLEVAGRDGILVAIGMNGVLLPREHGFPARLIHPGRYGMRSVKWLTGLTVTSEDSQGYWEKRGWDRLAEVRTASRFDAPRNGSQVTSPVTVAGIAWAGVRRLRAVEVSSDDGVTWEAADLEGELSSVAWRRWVKVLDLPPGTYSIKVRAIDGTGAVQDEAWQPSHPSGATGYDRIALEVIGVENG